MARLAVTRAQARAIAKVAVENGCIIEVEHDGMVVSAIPGMALKQVMRLRNMEPLQRAEWMRAFESYCHILGVDAQHEMELEPVDGDPRQYEMPLRQVSDRSTSVEDNSGVGL